MKVFIFYIFVILIIIAYFVYVGFIVKEQFILEPLTFLKNEDTVFAITQNLYCYDNLFQLILEKMIGTSILGVFLPKEWEKWLIDKIREANESSTDEYCLGIVNTDLKSLKFQNQTNNKNCEILVELDTDSIDDIDSRETDIKDGKIYIKTGDVVKLKITDNNGNSNYIRWYTRLGSNNVESGTVGITSGSAKWVIKIDKYYSENRFGNKIPNYGAVLFEVYQPESGTTLRLNTNCDYGKQLDDIKNLLMSQFLPDTPTNVFDTKSWKEAWDKDTAKLSFENFQKFSVAVQEIQRNRTIELTACPECYHWQIQIKNVKKSE